MEEFVTADDGCTLWADVSGAGSPLILCHGGPGLWDMFEEVALVLSTTHQVIRWDQRGAGRSDHRGPYSMSRSLRDLDNVRRHFALEHVALLGHSWGASLALRYTLDHPTRVSALVYVSGTGLGWQWRQPYHDNLATRLGADLPLLQRLEARRETPSVQQQLAILQWSADFADRDRAPEYARQMATPWFGINYACNTEIGNELKRDWQEPTLLAECRELTVPTMIVDGAQDIRPRWAVDSLAAAIADNTRLTLENTGHVPWLECPEPFYRGVTEFLTRRR